MSVLVTDQGFQTPAPETFATLADLAQHRGAVELAHTDDPSGLGAELANLSIIRVTTPAFSDGRAFTIARRLRMMGYKGRLRAHGPMIADQYAMARRVGFDEVEIPDDLAQRQPWDQWQFRADWQSHDYQSRLKA
ncbi:DUF934 domain-containing protein [Neotabrizicola shimadae]|uniref:DUF934 domain-containing protein n=1 Tax=Neotabrizicola shimadae TaxID=2807096 RepID=A0A8G0ZYK2_9RHOB|nr:DUF934 domain-containing protein [Neotabrizicola shimadae]QYZ71361.1 DUF934 domain-containing protein [Neotabrizicola shimadae]